MSGNYPAGVTDNHPEFDMPSAPQAADRDDAIDALQRSGMEPMDGAPKDREIVVVLEPMLLQKRVFWHDDIFGDGCWMDANGDGAPDSPPWRHWKDDELLGWLEVAP